jgi:hypothetical protein
MIIPAVSQSCDATKKHLHPGHNWHKLSYNSVPNHGHVPNLPMEPLRDVELEVDAEDDLDAQHQHQPIREPGMDILRECLPLMQVTQKICHHCNRRSQDLYRDVPSIPHYLLYQSVKPIYCGKKKRTPRTIPVGKMMPKDNIISRM